MDQKRLLTYMRYSLNHDRVRYSGDTDIYIDIPIIFMSVSGLPPGTLFSTFGLLPASSTATPEPMAAMTPLL